jgi:hypothetical protein
MGNTMKQFSLNRATYKKELQQFSRTREASTALSFKLVCNHVKTNL